MNAPFLEVANLCVSTAAGRVLFEGLGLRLSRERVALVGRNGVGKSTLLSVLSGAVEPRSGQVRSSSQPCFVPQLLPRSSATEHSHGQQRRRILAQAASAQILLLDEPSEDLDDDALAWLREWLREFRGCLLVASHDRRLLADFRHFFIASEAGCRYFAGSLAELEATLETERVAAEQRYAGNLNRLVEREQHALHVEHRKARKKRHGRVSELSRCTPRIRLNQKRGDAQVSHGRIARLSHERLDALRQWSKSTRRALDVRMPTAFELPVLPEPEAEVLCLDGVSAEANGCPLFRSLDLRMSRERVALVGPNGAGKTTLLEIALGRRSPSGGSVRRDASKIGSVAQGASDWQLDEPLLTLLGRERQADSDEQLARTLVAHKFPLALGQRPLRSLSPGERARAALICLFQRAPALELLLLDEPTFSLDLLGQRALVEALRAWPGGLLVASHDRAFLAEIGVTQLLELGR
jgi:ATPase subunit of ABC transporter with duplicated ATPase domains